MTEIRILLTDTNRWPVVPRLAIGFARMGCEVAVLCPTPGHPAEKASGVRRTFEYSGFYPLTSLKYAIEEFRPDVVVPACDRGVQHLHELYAEVCRKQGAESRVAATIERSLGAPDGYLVTSCRHALLRAAEAEGIAVPRTRALRQESDLEQWNEEAAVPWVMKADGTSGGRGVRFIPSRAEAAERFLELRTHAGWGELAKRLVLNRDRDWVLYDWRHPRPQVIAQSLIKGRPANCAVVCWRGQVLASLAVEVVAATDFRGPATVVKVVSGEEMIRAAEKLARRLEISGFFGLDFMIENGSGATYLIEMNPRCTPLCPLPLGTGSDLVAALWAQLAGVPTPETRAVTSNPRIAYFPQAWAMPEKLGALESCYHDLPQGEPALVDRMLHPWPERSRMGELVDKYWRKSRAGMHPITFLEEAQEAAPAQTSGPEAVSCPVGAAEPVTEIR